MDEIIRRLNYRTSGKIAYSAEEIPTLSPKSSVAEFMKGDENPYYKLERIDYPVLANGLKYTESFFDSFLKNMKDHPFPGSKNGHELMWGKRGPTDFITIGGMLESKGGGKGSVYLKNYVPPEGETGSNATFIKECKAGMVHFSIVTYPRTENEETKDGIIINVVESLHGERNDCVDYGTGAMKQTTNAAGDRLRGASKANVRKRINAGDVDNDSSWSWSASDGNKLLGQDGNDWAEYALWHLVENANAEDETKARYKYPYGKGGKVYRSALRAIASRASAEGLSDVSAFASEMIQLIDEKVSAAVGGDRTYNTQRGNDDMKKEFMEMLANAASEKVTLQEIAKVMNVEDQLVTKEHIDALAVVNSLKTLEVTDPVKEIETLRATIKVNAEAVKNAALDKEFGASTDEKPNPLRQYAAERLANATYDDLMKGIKEVKESPIAKAIAANMTDVVANVGTLETGNQQAAPAPRKSRVDKL